MSDQWVKVPKFIEPYLALRSTLSLCVCLIDSNIPPQDRDLQLIEYLRQIERPFILVATKADRLSGNERTNTSARLKRAFAVDDLLLCSAKTELGLKELWGHLRAIATH